MQQKFKAEFIFILITIALTILFIWPVYTEFGDRYPFYKTNIAFIIVFLTLTRYIFLLRFVPFSHQKWIKVLLLFLSIPLFLFLIDGFYEFQRYLDEIGLMEIAKNENSQSSISFSKYTRYQFLLFATGSIITTVLFPIRMVISIWRQVNKNNI